MILQEDGTPIFAHHRDSQQKTDPSFIPSLLTVIQTFAKGLMMNSEGQGIRSIALTYKVYTIKNFDLQTPSRKENRYLFILLTDEAKENSDLDKVLEYIVVNFLCYNNGEFVVKLRISATDQDEFDEFRNFMEPLMKLKFTDILKKKGTPPVCSFIQGMLNEMSEHIPAEKMVTWNDKLVQLGQSYVWLSEDLINSEEEYITEKVKEHLSDALYRTISERIQSQL
jgi:hypothetical protein